MTIKNSILVAVPLVSLLWSVPVSAEIRVAWLAQNERDMDFAVAYTTLLESDVGIEVKLDVITLNDSSFESVFEAYDQAVQGGVQLMMGLSGTQVQFLNNAQWGLEAVSTEQLGSPYMPVYAANNESSWSARATEQIVGIPFATSGIVACASSGNLESSSDVSISEILERAKFHEDWTVAMPSPATDSVGAGVLVASILEAGGVSAGWEVIGDLDAQVFDYTTDHVASCEQVVRGMADVGFTVAAGADELVKEHPWVSVSHIRDAAETPFLFASWMDAAWDSVTADERVEISRWIATRGVELNTAFALTDGSGESFVRMMPDHRLDYFPVQSIIDDWRLRFEHR